MLFVTSQNAEHIVALPLSAKRQLKASALVNCFMIDSSNVLVHVVAVTLENVIIM